MQGPANGSPTEVPTMKFVPIAIALAALVGAVTLLATASSHAGVATVRVAAAT